MYHFPVNVKIFKFQFTIRIRIKILLYLLFVQIQLRRQKGKCYSHDYSTNIFNKIQCLEFQKQFRMNKHKFLAFMNILYPLTRRISCNSLKIQLLMFLTFMGHNETLYHLGNNKESFNNDYTLHMLHILHILNILHILHI